jgi:hypothetical protein
MTVDRDIGVVIAAAAVAGRVIIQRLANGRVVANR